MYKEKKSKKRVKWSKPKIFIITREELGKIIFTSACSPYDGCTQKGSCTNLTR